MLAGTTDTEVTTNNFGMELEAKEIACVHCSDHNLQPACKLCHLSETFNANGARAFKEARDIVTFINKSTQVSQKLKQRQRAQDSFTGKAKTVVTIRQPVT